jgi:hypothetical protein
MKFKYIYISLFIFTFIVAVGSCSGRKSKTEHKDIIPEEDLISILTDAYITDGLLTLPKVNQSYSTRDSLAAYTNVIEKHGYTKEMMDRTMRLYFIKRPKNLIKIYDKVLGGLSEMESRLEKYNPTLKNAGGNLWKGKSFYLCPDPSGADTAWFDYPISYSRILNLKFTITIYPDDQSINPCSGIFIQSADTIKTHKREYFPKFAFVKDGQPHTFTSTIILKEEPPVKIKGWFIDLENQAPFPEKHFIVENIILSNSKL